MDMPKGSGKKGGIVTARSRKTLPAVTERVPRIYFNPNNVKPMNNRIKKCQGCPSSLRTTNDAIPVAPFNFCIARKEKRPFRDKEGNLRFPSEYTDAHYHLNVACGKAAEPTFDKMFLEISDEIPEDIKVYIRSM